MDPNTNTPIPQPEGPLPTSGQEPNQPLAPPVEQMATFGNNPTVISPSTSVSNPPPVSNTMPPSLQPIPQSDDPQPNTAHMASIQPLNTQPPQVQNPVIDQQPSPPQPPPQALITPQFTPTQNPVLQPEQPIVPPTAVIGQMSPMTSNNSSQKRSKKPLILAIIGLAGILLVGGGGAGAYFGIVVPNKPENVYKTGLSRSGKALDQLVNTATEKSQLDSFQKSDITLSVDASYNESTYAGTFNAKFDASKSESGLKFTLKDEKVSRDFNAKILSEVAAGNQYPDIYFQLNGLKSLGIDEFLPDLLSYEGKWIAVQADYLKSLGNVPTAEETSKKQLDTNDISELARAASSVTAEYVLSSEPEKAVFEKKSFVGKETIDGTNVYHYSVGFNEAHGVAYCKAMINKIYSTNAYKKLPWTDEKNIEKDKQAAIKDCDQSTSDETDKQTYDLWIDAKYKLIYKIRATDKDNKGEYVEIGQLYKGGDDVSLFVNYKNEKDKIDAKFVLDMNIKTATTKGTLTYEGGEDTSKIKLKVVLDAKPYKGEIKIEKPLGAIPIQDILKKFGIDPEALVGADSTTPSADIETKPTADGERKDDIDALQSSIEKYFANNGIYPLFVNINNATWRTANTPGITQKILQDPASSTYALVSNPTKNAYAYAVAPTGCNNTTKDCIGYVLTATLSDGIDYAKSSLD